MPIKQYRFPELCAWCGVNKPIRMEKVIKNKYLSSTRLEFHLPVCEECAHRLEKGRNISMGILLTGYILGGLFFIVGGISANEYSIGYTLAVSLFCLGPIIGTIFLIIGRFLTGDHYFQNRWGTYRFGKFHFNSKVFADRFNELNPFQ